MLSPTKRNLCSRIYRHQKEASIRRKHPKPTYSLEELYIWILQQKHFELLYTNWLKADQAKELIPSCDRINDYIPYTLDNLKLTTWEENRFKYQEDVKNGINNKKSKAVCQLTSNGSLIRIYHSAAEAGRNVGVHRSNITRICKNKGKFCAGFKWKYH